MQSESQKNNLRYIGSHAEQATKNKKNLEEIKEIASFIAGELYEMLKEDQREESRVHEAFIIACAIPNFTDNFEVAKSEMKQISELIRQELYENIK